MATIAQILDQAIRRLNELDPKNPKHWDRSELLVFLNEGVNELNLIAGEIQRTHSVAINSTDNLYTLPSTVIAPLSVRVGGNYLLKEPVIDLDREADWEDTSAVRFRPRVWSAFGLTQLIIYPRPLAAATMDVEALTGHTQVGDSPSVSLTIRPEYEQAIQDYIVSRALFKEGGAEFQQGLSFYARFLDAVQLLSGMNILRRYPAWDVAPDVEVSEASFRKVLEGQGS